MLRRSIAVVARAADRRAPTAAPRVVVARAVGTSTPADAPLALRSDAAGVAEPPLSAATAAAIARESRVAAHNYASVPVVIERAQGVHVWDVDGKRYLDALAGYSAVNQGHAHPAIVSALTEQAGKLGLVSRAFHSARFGEYAEAITTLFGYDKARAARRGRRGPRWRQRVTSARQRCPPALLLTPRPRSGHALAAGVAGQHGRRDWRDRGEALPPLVNTPFAPRPSDIRHAARCFFDQRSHGSCCLAASHDKWSHDLTPLSLPPPLSRAGATT